MLGKNFSSPLPSAFDSDGLPTVFSEYFLRRRSAPSETIFLLQTQLFSLMPLSPEIPYRPLTFVTDDFVLKMIKSTPVKSCELDPIPTTLLYDNLDILLPTITNIVNTFLTTGIVPRGLKTEIVKPLLKKPLIDKNLLKKYRPISNLPFLYKILEKVVFHKLLSFLQTNNLCNPFQSAYRAGYSTENRLVACRKRHSLRSGQ